LCLKTINFLEILKMEIFAQEKFVDLSVSKVPKASGA